MNQETYDQLRLDVERQSLRSMRRFLDYSKRVRQESGLDELTQWVARILHDPEDVYSDDERALAFTVGACEWLARRWRQDMDRGAIITVTGEVDKVRLLRLLITEKDPVRQCGLQQALHDLDGKLTGWIQQRALQVSRVPGDTVGSDMPFENFVEALEQLDPLQQESGQEHLEQELESERQQKERLRREIEAVTERAERAVQRLEVLEEEAKGLRKTLRDERDNGDKLRQERSKRIQFERDAREAASQLQRLKDEYVKLDQRLRETVRSQPAANQPLVEQLRQVAPGDLLGLDTRPDEESVSQARRRFAAVFHSDRTAHLPPWVADLFDHLLGLVNAACDKARK